MGKENQPRMTRAMIEADTAAPQDHTTFFMSGGRLLQKLACGLVPSFVHRKIRPNPTKSNRLHPTSYLDGLRGVASFIVFMGHYTEETVGWFTEPYGLYESGARSSPFQLPFIRVFYSPRPMVHIFFIISGYVLSYKPLKQIHSQQLPALSTTLSSSVFRRALRLFLPSIATLLIMSIFVYFNISDNRYAPIFDLPSDQLAHWWEACWALFKASWALEDAAYPQPKYNPALWTIPVEFAESLVLFITIIGLSRCFTHVRLLLLSCIIVFCFFGGKLFTVEFLGGMFLAELNLLQDRSLFTPTSSPTLLPKYDFEDVQEKTTNWATLKHPAMQAFWIGNVIIALFISSWTNHHPEDVWGIRFLNAHTPAPYTGQRVWFSIAAFQIVAACTQVNFLQNIFNTAIPQYLGNISYSLYLMHNLVLTTLERRVRPYLDIYVGTATFWGRHLTWVGGLAIYLPALILVADVFWRAIDTPTVKLARWLESKCIVPQKRT